MDIISLVVQNFCPTAEVSCLNPTQEFDFSHRVCGGWIEILPQLARTPAADEYLAPSVKALAVSILARGKHGMANISDALTAEAAALESLRHALKTSTLTAPNLLIANMMCLFVSEALFPTTPNGAFVHAKGIDGLMRLQGPETYASGDSHQLFVGARPVLSPKEFPVRPLLDDNTLYMASAVATSKLVHESPASDFHSRKDGCLK
nr:uncharacterized protein CTRU02_00363 [Colletotrichum truncatum]KAF6801614.1 hypothetical protein CTRU02_00363 [Colletotrichum truncatum]